jgi:hypothetical protein
LIVSFFAEMVSRTAATKSSSVICWPQSGRASEGSLIFNIAFFTASTSTFSGESSSPLSPLFSSSSSESDEFIAPLKSEK